MKHIFGIALFRLVGSLLLMLLLSCEPSIILCEDETYESFRKAKEAKLMPI